MRKNRSEEQRPKASEPLAAYVMRVKQECRAADAEDIAAGRRTSMQVSRDNLFVPPHWQPDWDNIPL